MVAALIRRAALPLLLLAGVWSMHAQQESPAARQQRADGRFLLRRGIAPASHPGAPMPALHTARAQQHALLQRQRRALEQGSALVLPGGKQAPSLAQPAVSGSTWQSLGPLQVQTPAYGLVTGRVSSLAADPNDTSGNTVYLGATGGGVWKSTNAKTGATFMPLTDDISAFANSDTSIPSLSIGALTVEPGNPQVVLAGTGDPNDALDSYYGVGILRSGDGGTSWNLVQYGTDSGSTTYYSLEGLGFAGFAWSTATTNLVVAAASQSLEGQIVNTSFSSSAEAGLYYSTDAGQHWILATITDGTNQVVQSPTYNSQPPGNPATSVVWNAQRKLFFAAIRFHGYYSSPDGITWTRLANQPGPGLSSTQCPADPNSVGSTSCPLFRGVLAVQPVTGDTFALTTDINNVDQGLYQDVCSTSGTAASSCSSSTVTFGKQIADGALDDPNITGSAVIDQADYNLALSAVSSQQDTILFAGTQDIFRCSLANSCTWRNTTNDTTCAAAEVAPSTHAIDSTFGASGLLYFGNDGGLWRSTNTVSQTGSVCSSTDSQSFTNLNGGLGSLAELSHVAVSPGSSSLALAGMGVFGVVASESTSAQSGAGSWQQILDGEGSLVAIDPTTPANWYADGGPGVNIFSCSGGSNCNNSGFGTTPVIGRSQVEDDADYFLDPAPWMLDPLNPANLIVGTCRMWLGPVTGKWSSSDILSPMLDGDQESFCDGNAQLRSVGAGGGSYNGSQGGEQMYAGMAGLVDGGGTVPGHLFSATVPEGGGTVSWTDLWRNPVTNTSLSSQFNQGSYAISAITVDPHDTTGKTVYVGIAGFPYNQSGVLYSTTDGGAHWANITNSLPQAPLNSIVVDPSTSGTVYVGGDFGVYATSSITSCSNSSQNCWAELGSGLPNAPVTGLVAATSGGSTVLEASTYGRGLWALGVAGTATYAQATLSPGSYSFPAQATGSASSPSPAFTLKNTGTVALAVQSITATPASDYAQTNNCGSSVSPNSTCGIQVTFTPSTTGDRPGTLSVYANTQAGSLTATLDGTGLTPGALSFSTTALSFPTTATGSTSASMSVTVTNTGMAPVQSIAFSIAGTNPGDFALAGGGNCGSTLVASANCTVPVTFSPTQANARTAQLQVTSNAPSNPQPVSLSGSGVLPAALSLSPSSLGFPSTPVNSVSASMTLTAANTGGVTAQLGTPTASPADYSIASNGCGAQLAPQGSCTMSIQFSPTATGSRSGLFTLPSSNIQGGQVTAPLSGTGLPAAMVTLSPSPVAFGNQQQGSTSAAMVVTVANASGASPAQLGTPTITGDFAVYSNNCPASLAAGNSCTLGLTFTPSAQSPRQGTLSVTYNSSTATDSLSGTGTAPGMLVFSPTSLSFAATADNSTSAPQSVTVSNSGANPAQISTTSTMGPFAVASSNCPQTLAANATCTLAMTFTPPGTASYTGTAVLSGTFGNTPASLPLSGQGATPPAATLSPGTLSFPDTAQGSASSAQQFTIMSTGGVPVTLSTPSVSADYQISANKCPATLAVNATCQISVLFHPAASGARPGTFTQPGNMSGGPLTASLSGNGLPPGDLVLSPGTYNFGPAVIGTTSASESFSVSNTGGAPESLGSPSSTGDYAVENNTCGTTLAAGQGCSIQVVFQPTASSDRPGQLSLTGNGATAVSTLDGTGTTPGQLTFMPASIAFGTVATGSTATSSITAKNSGGTTVHLNAITAAPSTDFAVAGGTCTPSTALTPKPPGDSCTVSVTFSPSATGSQTGSLTLANDGTPANATVGLAGVGATPGNLTLSLTSHDFGPVIIGSSASLTVTASNGGEIATSLGSPSIIGAGYTIANNTCGSTLPAKSSCTLQVVFSPSAEGAASGTLSFPGQYSNSPATATFSGTGITPGALSFSPSPIKFGSVVDSSTSSVQVTLKNTGEAPLALGTPTVSSGSFAVSSQCGSTLAPSTTCSVQVAFSPTAPGTVNGLLSVPEPSTGNSATDALSGTGVPPGALSASPTSLAFPATVVGSSSLTQQATFRNPGGVSVPLAAPQVSSSDYTIQSTTCSGSLDPSNTCTVTLSFTPKAAGNRPATVRLASSAQGGPFAAVQLDGSGLTPASLTFSPGALSFGKAPENTTTASQTLTLRNPGEVSTALGPAVLTGQYAITSNSCGSNLGSGASCTIAVQFAPTGSGNQPGTLSISGPAGTPSASATLSGTGQALALTPTGYSFTPPISVGSTSVSVLIGVGNLGSTPVTLQPPSLTGDFVLGSTSCGTVLPGQTTCAYNVAFTPTGSGLRTGSFTISDGAESTTATLSGTGLSPATDALAPTSLVFGATVIGQASAAQSTVLTNAGDSTLERISATISGPFQVSNNCGSTLAGHNGCSLAVAFAPTSLGSSSGTLTVTDAIRTQTVSLSGQGAAPPTAFAAPSSIDFGPYAVSVAAPVQTVTISNGGATPITNPAIATTSPAFSISNNECPAQLAPGANCSVGVIYTPGSIGSDQATLTVTSSSLASPLVVSLTGSGEDFQLAVVGSSSSVVTDGQTATYQLALTPVGASAGTVVLSCAGAPANALCTLNPSSVTLGKGVTGSIMLTVATSTNASSSSLTTGPSHSGFWWASGAALAWLLPFLRLAPAQRRRFLVVTGAALLLLTPLACGVHASGVNSSSTTQPGHTPSGSYSLTAGASFPGAQRTAAITLVVQ